jgi:hypothetical protein
LGGVGDRREGWRVQPNDRWSLEPGWDSWAFTERRRGPVELVSEQGEEPAQGLGRRSLDWWGPGVLKAEKGF